MLPHLTRRELLRHAAYRTGEIDCGLWHWWVVRPHDREALKKRQRQLVFRDLLSTVTTGIYMRTDKPPFNDVRVRRAISLAIDRWKVIESAYVRGGPTPAISRGLPE